MIRQHLVGKRASAKPIATTPLELTPGIKHVQGVDELVRRRFRRNAAAAAARRSARPEALAGNGVLLPGARLAGRQWRTATPPAHVARRRRLVPHAPGGENSAPAMAGQGPRDLDRRAGSADAPTNWRARSRRLIEECHDVRQGGLSLCRTRRPWPPCAARTCATYFRNETICGCDDRYRETLSRSPARQPQGDALRRSGQHHPPRRARQLGQPLRRTAANSRKSGAWPPPHYDANFWSLRDAR
jgi:hypothetical protein